MISFARYGRFLTAAWATCAAALASANEPVGEAVPIPENAFIRFVENEEGGKLETSVATYENAAGVKVDLIGAVHLGDAAYYDGLNEAFKDYQVVLYELVGEPVDKDAGIQKGNKAAQRDAAAHVLRGTQMMLTNLLQLQHQVAIIDYTAPNLVHADVDWEKFRALQKAKGESFATLLSKSLKAQKAMEKDLKKEGKALPEEDGIGSLLALAAAVRGSDTSGLKLILARQFEQAERMMGKLEGEEGTVIIAERNKVALAKMDEQIQDGKKNLGIFYGAGHFPDMEKRLLEAGFQRKETKWRTAWDIPKAKPAAKVKEAA